MWGGERGRWGGVCGFAGDTYGGGAGADVYVDGDARGGDGWVGVLGVAKGARGDGAGESGVGAGECEGCARES